MLRNLLSYFVILRSRLFDEKYYLQKYTDIRRADIDPIWHYVKHGWKEHRNPSQFFDTFYYLDTNPDVKLLQINPLLHYIRFGKKEGRAGVPPQKSDNKNIFIETQPSSQEFQDHSWGAWKEWTKLEPDRKYGFEFLCETRSLRSETAPIKFLTKDGTYESEPRSKSKTAVILHVFYKDMVKEIGEYLHNLGEDFDLYVSIPKLKEELVGDVFKEFPNSYVVLVENRGRDIAPFMEIYKTINPLGYEYLLKLHTKKSIHRQDGDDWRNDILNKLLSINSIVAARQAIHNDPSIGIIGPKGHILDHRIYWGYNKYLTLELAKEVGFSFSGDPNFKFVAGSMFWARPETLRFIQVLNVKTENFEPEPIPPDGTVAHAIERLIGLAAKGYGLNIKEIDEIGNIDEPGAGNRYGFAEPTPQFPENQ